MPPLVSLEKSRSPKKVDFVGITELSHSSLSRFAVDPLLRAKGVLPCLSYVSWWVDWEGLFSRYYAYLGKIFLEPLEKFFEPL